MIAIPSRSATAADCQSPLNGHLLPAADADATCWMFLRSLAAISPRLALVHRMHVLVPERSVPEIAAYSQKPLHRRALGREQMPGQLRQSSIFEKGGAANAANPFAPQDPRQLNHQNRIDPIALDRLVGFNPVHGNLQCLADDSLQIGRRFLPQPLFSAFSSFLFCGSGFGLRHASLCRCARLQALQPTLSPSVVDWKRHSTPASS